MSALTMSAAVVLQCLSPASAGGLTQPLVLNIEPEPADLRSLQERSPPMARVKFVGEAEKASEWQFAQDSDQIYGGTQVVRVSLPLSPDGAFVMRFGAAYPEGRKKFRFEELMRGTCALIEQGPDAK